MPRFIDFHSKMPTVSGKDLSNLRTQVGKKDEYGVTAVDAFFTTDSQAYCVSDGPDADSICRSHEAHGMKLAKGDVHEVTAELAR